MALGEPNILLIDPSEATRQVLARRLRARGYNVEESADPAFGAELALRSPPSVVISDLWMPGISGVQLCRLLRAEPATSELALVLCGETDDPRSRFWASRAGANAYVPKRRMSELMRILRTLERPRGAEEPFFFQLNGGNTAVRDRIARQLDKALFDSVIASEVRALASSGSFALLFELLLQFLQQVTRYRWLALATSSFPPHAALHHALGDRERAEREALEALELPVDRPLRCVEDEDASGGAPASPPLVAEILVGRVAVGRIAMAPCEAHCSETVNLFRLVASELGGPLRVALLVEEAQRLASIDPLTGIANRRAFVQAMSAEISRSRRYDHPVSILLLDVDHFKSVNDLHGHIVGDHVLALVGASLSQALRRTDVAGRWGGEEFAVLLPHTDATGAETVAERLREAVAGSARTIPGPAGSVAAQIPITVSVGVACLEPNESWETLLGRADHAMYRAKRLGRNRVVVAHGPEPRPCALNAGRNC
ncbi:MAG: diguanylate cyclase [Polyangiaceae bacterium]